MLGLSAEKLFLITLIAVFLIGPQRLPVYAAGLGRLVRTARTAFDSFTERTREELGPDLDAADWKKLDPRQYDPRSIIREALTDSPTEDSPAPPVRPRMGSDGRLLRSPSS